MCAARWAANLAGLHPPPEQNMHELEGDNRSMAGELTLQTMPLLPIKGDACHQSIRME